MGLAEAWMEHGICAELSIAAVECGFVWWADERTAIVGVQDLLTRETNCDCPCHWCNDVKANIGSGCSKCEGENCGPQIVGNEWKTTKEASKWWNEDRWLEGISEGSQIAIYANALRYGTYYPANGGAAIRPGADAEGYQPRIRVKAISKSNPPVIWPRRAEDGIITFSKARLEATRQALLSEAESIRARRNKVGLNGTWRIPGSWCVNQWKRTCEFHEDCVKQRPAAPVTAFDPSDPAFKLAIPHIDRIDNDLVILSASSYAKSCECAEAYRRGLAREGKESSMALDTGTVFHGVVACYYQQLKEYQEAK